MREETFKDRNEAIYSKQTGVLEITDELLGNPPIEFDSAETWIPTKAMEESCLEGMAKEIQVIPRNVEGNVEHHFEVVSHLNEQQEQLFNMLIKSISRVRTLEHTEDDLETLSSRLICHDNKTGNVLDSAVKYYLDLKKQDPSVMALFPLTKEVNEFNHAVLQNSGEPVIVVQATETSNSIRSCNKTRRPDSDKNHRLTANNVSIVAGGLLARLLLSLNCRVMLRRNIDRVEGLVNGITGTVSGGGCICRNRAQIPRTNDEERAVVNAELQNLLGRKVRSFHSLQQDVGEAMDTMLEVLFPLLFKL
ncbi:hypothetical protein CAEBREN_23118 [Caenorhabditis brenneri]|uniref:DNA helicase n=1 Tax=Caenorhabditis brenneri TaxID=135651 RepID=G0NIH0_CAEBE|nr:hypothetical protein CAEBREN_23118 [Caenorhabditis brenneri]